MTSIRTLANSGAGIAVMAATAVFLPSPVSAANFFEQLFGGTASSQVQPAPAPVYETVPAVPSAAPYVWHRRPHASDASPEGSSAMPYTLHRRTRVAVFSQEPVRQKTTDLAHDSTLRTGDAVVTKTGIEVYAGPRSARHGMTQFIKLDDAEIAETKRRALIAEDTTRVDPLANAPLREGRSTSASSSRIVPDAVPVATGFKITDARGNSVRYVGP